jgi:hypothetical protein
VLMHRLWRQGLLREYVPTFADLTLMQMQD